MKVVLNDVSNVQDFVNTCSKFDFDIYMQSGRYIINAKSIMGVLSLDLSKPVDVKPDTMDISTTQTFYENIVRFRE